jgi:hypothetical protein
LPDLEKVWLLQLLKGLIITFRPGSFQSPRIFRTLFTIISKPRRYLNCSTEKSSALQKKLGARSLFEPEFFIEKLSIG